MTPRNARCNNEDTDTVFGLSNSLHRVELEILRKMIYYLKYY